MTIENLGAGAGADAGAGGGTEVPGAGDVGVGRLEGNDAFALPDNFEDNLEEIEVPADGGTQGTEGGQTPPAGQTEGQTPPAQQTQQQTPPAAGQQPPAQTPQQQTPPQPAQPAVQTPSANAEPRIYSPGELAQELGKNRDVLVEALAQQKFQLSPADVQALDTDAVGILPKLMARVYYEASVNGLQQLANMVPRMVEQVTSAALSQSAAEGDFHKAWPNIDQNNAEHMRVVSQLATTFRQMNPRASLEDAIKYVGHAATSFLGLPAPQAQAQTQVPTGRPVAAVPARRAVAPPFSPANGGRAQPPVGTPTQPADAFFGMGQNYDGE